MRIVQRLLLIVLLSAIPLCVLQVISVQENNQEERREVSLVALRTAYRAAAEQRRVVEGARQLLAALAQLPAVRDRDASRCNLIMRRLQAQFSIYTAIGVSDGTGHLWCSSARTGTNISDRAYFRTAVASRQFTTGGFIVGRVTGKRTLNFSFPFTDQAGRITGVLIAGLDLVRLADDLGRTQLPEGGRLFIVDTDKRILVDLPGGGGVGMMLPKRLHGPFGARRAGLLETTWIDGSDRLIGFVPPAADPGMPFLIGVGIARTQALSTVEQDARRDLAVLMLTIVSAMLLAWWFATRFVRRPLQRLAGTTRAWREGDTAARVGRLDPGSEFDDLSRAFDDMADAMEERQRQLRDALESTTDSVLTIGPDWQVTFLNGRAKARLPDLEQLAEEGWGAASAEAGPEVRAVMKQAMADRQPAAVTFEYKPLGGHFEAHVFPAPDGGLTLFIRDVTEQHRAQQELRHLALNDPLTGLPNRVHAMDIARRRAAQNELSAMVVLDLDGFKHVNDSLGHPAGDRMLREVALRLTTCLGPDGLVARLGGDEFVALLFGMSEPRSVQIGHALLKCLEDAPFLVLGQVHQITSSCGLVLVPDDGNVDVEDLLANADLALYRAKQAGGGTCRTYSTADRDAYESRRRLEEEVARAAVSGEFELHYQPQVRLDDGALIGAEALLRWRHPQRGLLAPGDFIDVLECSRHARTVGDWIIDEACRQAASWRAAGIRLRISVNLFAEQVRSSDLAGVVEAALMHHRLPRGVLELELTENIALAAESGLKGRLLALQALGVSLAFDDFGTGFASLTALKDFPVDRLKIDRGFVMQLPDNEHDKAIVEAVLALSRTLDLEVIAEGVETAAQEAYLRARGCGEAQGYRYAAAMPPEAFLAYAAAMAGSVPASD